MSKADAGQKGTSLRGMLALLLGGLLAIGVELVVLLLGAIMVSAGIIRTDAVPRITAAACLVGCMIGGLLTCACWNAKRLFGGLLTGMVCFLLIVLISLFGGNHEFSLQCVLELGCCVVGGGLAGIASAGRKKTRKKTRK